jgi:hypothetical protein
MLVIEMEGTCTNQTTVQETFYNAQFTVYSFGRTNLIR